MAPSRLPKKRNWGRPLGPPIKDPIRIRGSGDPGSGAPVGTPLGAAYRVGTRPLDPGTGESFSQYLYSTHHLNFFRIPVFPMLYSCRLTDGSVWGPMRSSPY